MLTAKSAGDRTGDWPFWMVWNGSVNVTIKAIEAATGQRVVGMPFLPRAAAEKMADFCNEKSINI